MAEWAGIVATTTSEFIKSETVQTLRNRKFLAMLNDRGRITTGHSGINFDWPVRYKQVSLQGNADMATLAFNRTNRWKRAVLDWRGYVATDLMSEKERLENSGAQALVKRYANASKILMSDVDENIAEQVYGDGNAAGREDCWHGLESFFANSGAAGGGFIGTPSDTYAGLSCVPGNYGGTWTGNWPDGTGDAHYDFWSPLIVDYTDTAWTAATKTWPNTCLEALTYGIITGKRNKGTKNEQMDIGLLANGLYRELTNALRIKEQLVITPNVGSSGLWKLGFKDIINYDGVDFTWEYGLATGVGYGLCMDQIELRVLGDELFYSKGPEYSMDNQTWRWLVGTFSNLMFESVRHHTKWMSIT